MFLQQLFFPCKSFNDFNSIKSLEKYMLNNENIKKYNFIEKTDAIITENQQILTSHSSSPELTRITTSFQDFIILQTDLINPLEREISSCMNEVPEKKQEKKQVIPPLSNSYRQTLSSHSSTPKGLPQASLGFAEFQRNVTPNGSQRLASGEPRLCTFLQKMNNIKPNEINSLVYVKKEDSLFWCIFISHYGIKEYNFIGNKYANRELEEKKTIMEHIKNNSSSMKQLNFKVSNVLIQEIMSDLLLNKKTSFATFLAFVSYYKKRVFIVNKNTYLMYNFENTGFQYYSPDNDCSDDTGVVLIQYNPDTKSFGIDMEINQNVTPNGSTFLQNKIQNIINTKFNLEHYLKPLKGVSNYKVCELETIAGKLKIQYNPNIKKNDLYQLIYMESLWSSV